MDLTKEMGTSTGSEGCDQHCLDLLLDIELDIDYEEHRTWSLKI